VIAAATVEDAGAGPEVGAAVDALAGGGTGDVEGMGVVTVATAEDGTRALHIEGYEEGREENRGFSFCIHYSCPLSRKGKMHERRDFETL